MEKDLKQTTLTTGDRNQTDQDTPQILEEIVVEELSIDGICGVY